MPNPLSLLVGWVLDLLFGDPQKLPHPVVWFGRMIAAGEEKLNKGSHRKLKGALMAIVLILFVFALAWMLRRILAIFALLIYDGTSQQGNPNFLQLFLYLNVREHEIAQQKGNQVEDGLV